MKRIIALAALALLLPLLTATAADIIGPIKVDGTSITATADGTLSAAGGGSGCLVSGATGMVYNTGASTCGTITMTDGQLVVGQTGAAPLAKTLSGDGTLSAGGALTLTKVNGVTYPSSFTSGGIPYASATGAISSSGVLTANAFITGGGAGTAPNAVAITGLALGNGASAPSAYGGTSCTNQMLSALSAAGAGTCNSVTNSYLAAGTFSNITGTGTLTAGATGAGFTVALSTSTITGTLPAANLPNPSATTLGGIESLAAVTSKWINAISTAGVPSATQPAFSDISGSVAAAQLPNPSASTLGGIESLASSASKWINAISTSGVPSATQPASTDLSDASGLAYLGTNQSFTKGQAVTPVGLTDGATITPDASLSNNFTVTLGGSRTLANPTNLKAGQTLNFWVTQDGTGSRVLTYGSQYQAAGSGTTLVLSTAASAKDLVTCISDTTTTLTCSLQKAISH